MTSHVRKWFKWQRAGIGTVLRNRVSRANNGKYDGEIFAACSMSYVAIDANLSASLTSGPLAKLGDLADAYLTRTLCYVARTSALKGEITVTRSLFGPKVLSTDSRLVSSRKGGQVWDAMHAADFLVEGPADIPEWVHKITDNLKDATRLDTHPDTHQDTHLDTLSCARAGSGSCSGSCSRDPNPPTPFEGVGGLEIPEPGDPSSECHGVVLTWASMNSGNRSETLSGRAKAIIRENGQLRGKPTARMDLRESGWIKHNDPDGWRRAERRANRAKRKAVQG